MKFGHFPDLTLLPFAPCSFLQGYEPTSMRAIRARYDPYEQSKGRVEQLRALGHSVDKVRLAARKLPLLPALRY